MSRTLCAAALAVVALTIHVCGQQAKKPSPDAYAATQVGGRYVGAEPTYLGGKWIEISYGGPIKRGRDLWGKGDNYGKMLENGAPVWRAGADVTTYLMTQATLEVDGKRIDPGGYSLFVDLAPDAWTLIISNWQPQRFFNPNNRDQLWGSFGYTRDKDIVRARMTMTTLPFSLDQLTWSFVDMSDQRGKLALMWDKAMAVVPFAVVD